MAYDMSVRQRPDYLHVQVKGDISPETIRSYLVDVHAACLSHKCSRVLIEEDLKGPALRTFDAFSVILDRAPDARQASLTIAYVDLNPEHDPVITRFAETAAVNRGVNVRAFETVAEADNWLRGSSDQASQA